MLKFGLGIGIGGLLSLITVPILAWFVNPENVGIWGLSLIYITLFSQIISVGFDHSLIREFNQSNNKQDLLNSLISPSIFASLLLLAISYLINFDFKNLNILPLICLGICLTNLNRYIGAYARCMSKALSFSTLIILPKLSVLLSLIICLYLKIDITVEILLASNILGLFIGSVFSYFNLGLKIRFRIESYNQMKFFFLYSSPLWISSILLNLTNNMDRIIISSLLSELDLGIYVIAIGVVGALIMIQVMFSTIWFPFLFRKEDDLNEIMLQKIFDSVLDVFTMLYLIFNILVIVAIKFLPSVYSELYYLTLFISQIPLCFALSEIGASGLHIKRETNKILFCNLVGVFFNFFLLVVLINNYGLIGAAMAQAATSAFLFFSKTILSNKLWLKIKFKSVLNFLVIINVSAFTIAFFAFDPNASLSMILLIFFIFLIFRSYEFYNNISKIKL